MPSSIVRTFLLFLAVFAMCGCTAWQPTKEVWKTTRGLWHTYVSPPASVDYDDKGDVPAESRALAAAMVGVDVELTKLERVMQNADKPPTQEWLSSLFASFPWLDGFAGVKYDGAILGQEPPDSLKKLDFIPLLYEDKKQGSRALRADMEPGPLGPELMLATPLYDGVDFLGIVVAYFDMRSLMRYSSNANDIVVLCPHALLWPGKYDFGQTPLAGVDWAKVTRESTGGACSNATGTFYYMVRYFANLPLVFAIPAKGAFPEGNGDLAQGNAYFPQERQKLPPPPMPEGKRETRIPAFEKPEPEPGQETGQAAPPLPEASERHVIQEGSHESMLLQKKREARRRQVEERQLEGENVQYEPRRAPRRNEPRLELIPDAEGPTLPGGRPSPFGPRPEAPARPSPFGPPQEEQPQVDAPAESAMPEAAAPQEQPAAPAVPAQEAAQPGQAAPAQQNDAKAQESPRLADGEAQPQENAAEKEAGAAPHRPATLPGGRPSPFGPR